MSLSGVPMVRVLICFAIAIVVAGATTTGQNSGEDSHDVVTEGFDLNWCGPFAFMACAAFLGAPVDQQQLEGRFANDGRLTTFCQLADAASDLGFATAAIKWNGRPTLPSGAPAILAVQRGEFPHFVAAVGADGDRLLIIDFPRAGWVTYEGLRNKYHWNGEALHIARSYRMIFWLYALLYWKEGAIAMMSLAVFVAGIRYARRRRAKSDLPQATSVAPVLACAVSLAFVLGCDAQSVSNSVPIARIDPQEIVLEALGSTGEQREREAVVHVVNSGHDVVRIVHVVTDCGCTSIGSPTATLLNPGQTADIAVRAHLPSTGERKSRVAVSLEAASVQQTLVATLIMRGPPIQVPAVIRLPGELVLRRDAQGNAMTTVSVHTYEKADSSPWIGPATVDCPIISVKPLGIEEARCVDPGVKIRVYTYSVGVQQAWDSGLQEPRTTASVTLCSAARNDVSVGRFHVRLERWRPFRLIPESLFVDRVGVTGDCIERAVRIVFSDERFHPTEVKARGSEPWIRVKAVTFNNREQGKEALVTVELQPKLMPNGDSMRAKLTVTALGDQDDSASETLPVIVKMRSAK